MDSFLTTANENREISTNNYTFTFGDMKCNVSCSFEVENEHYHITYLFIQFTKNNFSLLSYPMCLYFYSPTDVTFNYIRHTFEQDFEHLAIHYKNKNHIYSTIYNIAKKEVIKCFGV
jgi:hypothetical protein